MVVRGHRSKVEAYTTIMEWSLMGVMTSAMVGTVVLGGHVMIHTAGIT